MSKDKNAVLTAEQAQGVNPTSAEPDEAPQMFTPMTHDDIVVHHDETPKPNERLDDIGNADPTTEGASALDEITPDIAMGEKAPSSEAEYHSRHINAVATTNGGKSIEEESTIDRKQALADCKENIARLKKNYEQSYIELGQELLKAKEIFGKKHGEWLDWVKLNVDLSITKVQRLMRIARLLKEKAALVPHLDYTKALILTRIQESELNAFLESGRIVKGKSSLMRVEQMTKRELEDVVREYLKELREAKAPQQNQNATEPAPNETPIIIDNIDTRMKSVKASIDHLVELIAEKAEDSSERELAIEELRSLLDDTIMRFAADELAAA